MNHIVTWEPEGRYCCTKSMAITPFWLSTDDILTQISYSYSYWAHLKKQRFAWVKKEKNVMKSQEVSFEKSQKLLTSRAGNSPQTKPIQRLHNPPLNWMNSYWNVLNRLPLWSSLGEQFLWFSKNDLFAISPHFSPVWYKQSFVFFWCSY